MGAKDDTLPDRWFDEENTAGPFKGQKIDRKEFEKLKQRFYKVSGLDENGVPAPGWREQLARATTGYTITVTLPDLPGVKERQLVIDQPVGNIVDLRELVKRRMPAAAAALDDHTLGITVNDEMAMKDEAGVILKDGDRVQFVPQIAGG